MTDHSAINQAIPNNQQLQATIDQAIDILPVGIWIIDADTNIIYANQAAQEIWEGVEYVGSADYNKYQAWFADTNQPVANQDWAALKALNEGKKTINQELKIKSFAGTSKVILNSAIPITDDQGNIISCVILNQDISALRNSEADLVSSNQELKDSNQEAAMFKVAVDQASEHIVITDPEGIIIYANQSVERITGYTTDEVMGTKAGELWSKPMPTEFYQKMWKTIKEEKQVFEGEIINRKKSGQEYQAQVTITPILNQSGELLYFLALERDITQQKQVEQAKSDFVSFASHQLRTPLTAIKWYSEMLTDGDGGELTPQQAEFVREIHAGNERMIELVSSLLNVSRIEMGTFSIEPTKTNVVELLTEVLLETKTAFHHKELEFAIETEELGPVLVDPKLLRIVYQNLLSNASKYSHNQGKIWIRLKKVAAGSCYHAHTIPVEACYFEVQDNGIGIPDNDKQQIFSKLFRADNASLHDTTGTGLGLYITKAIITASGGELWFGSSEGEGSTFSCWFPLEGMEIKSGTKQLEINHDKAA